MSLFGCVAVISADAVVSGYTLGDLYWQHVEQFPSHSPNGLSLAVDDLIAIFIHGQGDHMTSENSTFPYVAKECKNFIRILEGAKQRLDHPGSICVVARLWSVICECRFCDLVCNSTRSPCFQRGAEHRRITRKSVHASPAISSSSTFPSHLEAGSSPPPRVCSSASRKRMRRSWTASSLTRSSLCTRGATSCLNVAQSGSSACLGCVVPFIAACFS